MDKRTRAIKWTSKDFGGAVAEMHPRAGTANRFYDKAGGTGNG